MDTFVPITSMSFTWINIMPGRCVFVAELVNNGHTHLDPPAYSMINVIVI